MTSRSDPDAALAPLFAPPLRPRHRREISLTNFRAVAEHGRCVEASRHAALFMDAVPSLRPVPEEVLDEKTRADITHDPLRYSGVLPRAMTSVLSWITPLRLAVRRWCMDVRRHELGARRAPAERFDLSSRRWPLLVALYLASRLVALTALPMFLDERIHLRWAFWIRQGRRLRLPFISGRGLSVWLLAAIAPQADDPLRTGRLLTVAVGLVTMVACHRLAWRATGDRRIADVTALFYIACPFTLFYDRMVLTDSFLACFTALTLLVSLRLAAEPRARTGLALGLAVALGILSKTTGLVLLAVPLLNVVLDGRDRA